MFPPFDLVVPKRLEVVMTTTEGNLSAINESLVQLRRDAELYSRKVGPDASQFEEDDGGACAHHHNHASVRAGAAN